MKASGNVGYSHVSGMAEDVAVGGEARKRKTQPAVLLAGMIWVGERKKIDLSTGRSGTHRRQLRVLADAYRCASQTGPPVVRNCTVQDGPAIDALPGVKDQKEVREPLEHHQAFTAGALHLDPPG